VSLKLLDIRFDRVSIVFLRVITRPGGEPAWLVKGQCSSDLRPAMRLTKDGMSPEIMVLLIVTLVMSEP